MMHRSKYYLFITGLVTVFMISCSKPVEKQIPGIWKIDDVAFVADSSQFDLNSLKATAEEQKTLRFNLKADNSLDVSTGFATLKGKWLFKKDKNSVFINYDGSPDTLLMGIWQDGKLINDEKNTVISVKTTFVKEK
jgi:hypothetical protein